VNRINHGDETLTTKWAFIYNAFATEEALRWHSAIAQCEYTVAFVHFVAKAQF
jgi:hypothetical protein